MREVLAASETPSFTAEGPPVKKDGKGAVVSAATSGFEERDDDPPNLKLGKLVEAADEESAKDE